ncbi:MAG: Ku protein [Ruminococcaceae bacterium]|nr:Ku protein [Oscillospiraceae bacterium]
MRAIWIGNISFGLVNIPVSLMGAEEPKELTFSLMDSRDHAKIKYQRINANTGKEVPWSDIVKYYEFPDGSYVTVTDEDFEKADPKAAKAADIEAFIEADELSPMQLEKPYYIVPTKGGEKAFVLLRDAMLKTGRIGIGKVTIRTRQSLCAIMPCDEGLVLILLRYDAALRGMEALNLPKNVKTTAKEMELAVSLINTLAVEWKPEDYKDEYADALMARIEAKAKAKGKELPDEPSAELQPTKVIDLMALLRESVETRKAGKSDTDTAREAKQASADKAKKKTS